MYSSMNFYVCINTCNHHPNQETENFQYTKILSSAPIQAISQSNPKYHYIFVYQYRNLASILICIPFITSNIKKYGLSQWLSSKEYACNAVDTGDVGSISELGRYPGEGMETIPVFLPGESLG